MIVNKVFITRIDAEDHYITVADEDGNAHVYLLSDQDTQALRNLLIDGIETTYKLNDGIVAVEIHLKHGNNLLYSINDDKLRVFRKRLGSPKAGYSST